MKVFTHASTMLSRGTILATTVLLWIAITPFTAAQTTQQSASGQTQPPAGANSSEILHVMVGRSLVINSPSRLKRVSIADPNIADAVIASPTEVIVNGKATGGVSLVLWDESGQHQNFDLIVDPDLLQLQQRLQENFPNEQIQASASRDAVVLSGRVSSQAVADRVFDLGKATAAKVVNLLQVPAAPAGAEVLLEVKFAEVDRTAIQQLGFNLLSTGATNTIGTLTTGQFGGFGNNNITDAFPRTPGSTFTSNFPNVNGLNLFLFRPDIHLGAAIQALQQQNLLQILAEPNLIALNGKEASFLAGGEFPFPVVQPSQGFTAVTIIFKEFGVRLKFTPLILPNGNIHLHVAPEVSSLDFSNALTISGFSVPALSTRRAESELELQDGQSFVIAGLLDNRVNNIASKFPGLGDIPIIGTFFKSKNQQKTSNELMVMVTAHRINASAQPAPLPKFPEKFMGTPSASVPGSPAGPTGTSTSVNAASEMVYAASQPTAPAAPALTTTVTQK
jgi:pilus assembly protein CpaC